jgi:hypothetical protein
MQGTTLSSREYAEQTLERRRHEVQRSTLEAVVVMETKAVAGTWWDADSSLDRSGPPWRDHKF